MKKINEYLNSHPMVHAFIAMGENLLAWLMFIIFYFVYSNTIDWAGYNEAIKKNPDINITNFYSDTSLIFYFFGFLFLALGIFLSIYVVYRWLKVGYIKLKEKADE